LGTTGPPWAREPGLADLHIERSAALDEPRLARGFVRDTLRAWGFDSLVDAATLVTSELVTNCLRHAHSGATLSVRLSPVALRIGVCDPSSRLPLVRQPDEDETGGRGMLIVDALASRWGTDLRPGDGKEVWAEFARPDVERLAGYATEGRPSSTDSTVRSSSSGSKGLVT
jgi:serine/threonine-protein kinase RsbW